MRAILSASSLQEALKNLGKVAISKCSIPALMGVRVVVDGQKCRMTATNLDMWLTAEVEANGDSFSFLLPDAKDVLKGVKYFTGDIEISLDGDHVSLECGDMRHTMTTGDLNGFPEPRPFEALNIYQTSAADLFDRFKKV